MKKIIIRLTCICIGFAAFSSWAQIGHITNPGKVVDSLGQPLKNAMITYTDPAKDLNYDFTDANGYFGPAKPVTGTAGKTFSTNKMPGFIDNVKIASSRICFYLNAAKNVSIELSNSSGRKIAAVLNGNLEKGSYSVDLSGMTPSRLAGNIYFVKVQAGGESVVRKFVSMENRTIGQNGSTQIVANQTGAVLAKKMAATDTVRVGKTGYKPVYVPINQYTDSIPAVTLHKIDIEARVDSVLSKLSSDQKAMLMVMVDMQDNPAGYQGGTALYDAGNPGSASDFNSKNDTRMSNGPKIPLLIGYDCVHGFIGSSSVQGTMFPHNQAMGCIQDTTLMQMAGRITAIEAATRGIYWAFAPCIAVCRDEHWGRIYEGGGEVPEISAKLAMNEILGMQGRDLSLNTSIVATAKHFAGDGGTQGGTNAGNDVGADSSLRAIHLPPYKAAIAAEVACIMPSFSSWNGVGMTQNGPLLTDWLKTQQGFDGFVVGDWWSHQPGSPSTTIASFNAGLDNAMAPYDNNVTLGIIKGAASSLSARMDDACKRILRVLFRKGMFENYHALAGYDSRFYSSDHRNVARQCVAASMVVLKDSSATLPLAKTGLNIAVIGNYADNIRWQCGGWTLGWQGVDPNTVPKGVSLLQALKNQGSNTVNAYTTGDNIPSNADIIIVTAGNNPNAEYTKSDDNIKLLAASVSHAAGSTTVNNSGDQSSYQKISDLMNKAKAAGKSSKKIVLMLFSDGPAVVTDAINASDAVVCAWLGCPEGDGYADILYGTVKPTGKLNFAWPATIAQIPINLGNHPGIAAGDGSTPLFPLGYGLTY